MFSCAMRHPVIMESYCTSPEIEKKRERERERERAKEKEREDI